MRLSPQQRRFLYTHNHPSVQSVKQQEAAAYVDRLNQRLQALQQQQVSREHRAALREQRSFFLAIICAIILVAIAFLLFVQHISLNQANKR
jgi:CHASE3 domain sensor protein